MKSKFMRYIRLAAFLPVIIWMIIIVGFSGQDGEESSNLSQEVTDDVVTVYETVLPEEEVTPKLHEYRVENLEIYIRKLAHMSEYAVLFLLLFIAFRVNNLDAVNFMLVSFIICVFYAASDEIHQVFVPGREGIYKDVLIDSSGSFIMWMIVLAVSKIKEKKENNKGNSNEY